MQLECISVVWVVRTWFSDLLASGARDQIQDMDRIWPGLPEHKAARQHARAPDVVFTLSAKHGGGGEYKPLPRH